MPKRNEEKEDTTFALISATGGVLGYVLAREGAPRRGFVADAMLDDGGTFNRRPARLSRDKRLVAAAERTGRPWYVEGRVAGDPVWIESE